MNIPGKHYYMHFSPDLTYPLAHPTQLNDWSMHPRHDLSHYTQEEPLVNVLEGQF